MRYLLIMFLLAPWFTAHAQDMTESEAKQVVAAKVKDEVRGRVILRGTDYLSVQVLQSNHPDIRIGEVVRIESKVPLDSEAGVEALTSPTQVIATFIARRAGNNAWTAAPNSMSFTRAPRVATRQ